MIIWLVVSTYPSEKYESMGRIIYPIYEMENKKMFETTNQNNSIGHPTRNGRKSSQKILTAPCLQEPISAMENILQDLSSKSIAGSAPSDFWASHPKHHEKLQCSWNSYGFMNYMIYYIYIIYYTWNYDAYVGIRLLSTPSPKTTLSNSCPHVHWLLDL